MASNPQPGRKALIVVVAAAMVGTLGLMLAAMRPAATMTAVWPRFSAAWKQQERIHASHREVPLTAGVRRIEIVTDGKVRVTPGAAGKLSIDANVHVFGTTLREADEMLKVINWTVEQAYGSTVRLTGNFRSSDPRIQFNGRVLGGSPYTDFEVQAPPGLQVVVQGDEGEVYVAGMAGAEVKTDSGEIHVAGLTGDLIAEADSGSVSVRDLKGDVKATTDSGSVTVVNASGTVKAEADSGSIRVEKAGRATLRCDHGKIEARHVAGALEAETSTGRIVAEDVGAGARLTSEHGSIDARRIHNGRLTATTETGAIDLDQPGITDVDYDLRTEHGSVALAVPKSAALTVDLKSEHGHIQDGLGLPAASEHDGGGQTVTGRLGDGKRRLAITSETGSIDLRPAT